MKLPLPAVDVLLNEVKPALPTLDIFPWLVNLVRVKLPAVALLLNTIPPPPLGLPVFAKFCVFTVLFVMPVPLMVRKAWGFTVMPRACVSEAVNVIAAIEFGGVKETKTTTTLERLLNVAVSPTVVPG